MNLKCSRACNDDFYVHFTLKKWFQCSNWRVYHMCQHSFTFMQWKTIVKQSPRKGRIFLIQDTVSWSMVSTGPQVEYCYPFWWQNRKFEAQGQPNIMLIPSWILDTFFWSPFCLNYLYAFILFKFPSECYIPPRTAGSR